jgi:hypothetical protein
MPRHARLFSYVIATPPGAEMLQIRTRHGMVLSTHTGARTMRAALRQATGFGPGAVVMRRYLHGKRAGTCREWTIRGAAPVTRTTPTTAEE